MEKAINALGIAIIASKYAGVILFAGLTLSTGALAADALYLTGAENND
ncbi:MULTISPECIES: hypothetical protein [Vibrio]|uniref:Uncharacterized protein n=1 Tax=Vibrio cortegadensis TaxID=1328770 RepID=A0ABV4M478_9VIBR|nr:MULTISPECIES: hypothetical protein [Vibrio]MDN3697376.1 hypothetical protein [Vibrio cortegadensis]